MLFWVPMVARVWVCREQVALIKDSYITAGERNIYTGDSVEIIIMTKDGTKKEIFELKKD